MVWIALLGALLLVACIAGWVVGEIFGKALLRVLSGLVLIPLIGVVPFVFGHAMGSFNA